MYLILDTNIWIYLANGFNPETNNYEDGLHFKILESLKHLVSNGKITLLTNEIIVEEWERNKQKRFALIEKHQKSLDGQTNMLKSIRKKLDKEDHPLVDELILKYQTKIQLEISNNQKHIEEVEELLENFTTKFNISDVTKIKVTDWAVKKMAPFKGAKSNSTADALILFGAVEYLTALARNDLFGEPIYFYPDSIFVSSNSGDFSDAANNERLHQDLMPIVSPTKMGYSTSLIKTLNAVEELFKESEVERIEEEIEELHEFYCEVCEPDEEKVLYNIVFFEKELDIESRKLRPEFDPNQADLFPHLAKTQPKEDKEYRIELGTCQYCGQEYLVCLQCNTVNVISEEYTKCEGCGEVYKQVSEYIGSGMYETTYEVVESSEMDEED